MDPEEALRNLLRALTEMEPDRHAVYHHLEDLMGWVDRGGFLPRVREIQWPPQGAFVVGV